MIARNVRKWSRFCVVACALTVAACAQSAPPLVTRPTGPVRPLLVRHVAVFDGEGPARQLDRDVLVDGGVIRTIAAGGTLQPTAETTVIDGTGRTLLPGLIDMHGHVGNSPAPPWLGEFPDADRNLQSYLYCGVTTVLDPADLVTEAFARRRAVAAGEILGPQIFAAGPMFTAPGGHPIGALHALAPWWIRWYLVPRFSRQVANAAEAKAAVDALAPEHPDVIKVAVDAVPLDGPILDPTTLAAVVAEARTHGIRTVAHVGTTADALEAADAGVAAWMHGVYKERIPDAMLPRFVAAKIPMVATINVFDSYSDLFEGRREATELERETAPAAILDAFLPVPEGFDTSSFSGLFRAMAEAREARHDNVRRLHAAGVTILAGADAQSGVFPGPGLHRELGLLVASGLTPADALRAATGDAARFLADGKEPDRGRVAEGKRADLVLVDGDPTADIAAVSRIHTVVLGGVPLERHRIAKTTP